MGRPDAISSNGGLSRTFSFIIARRWYVLACYTLLLLPSAYFAAKVRQDNSLDRLITATDPDYIAPVTSSACSARVSLRSSWWNATAALTLVTIGCGADTVYGWAKTTPRGSQTF